MLKESEMIVLLPFAKDVVVKVVRHVSNIAVIASEEHQYSCQVTFSNNQQRDVFTVLIRSLIKRFADTPDQTRLLGERDFYRKKEELW
jgi:hypothetical protein